MREFMEFMLHTFSVCVSSLFEIEIGDYSYGHFLTAVCVLSIFVSTLVVRFRSSNDVSSVSKPAKRPKQIKIYNYHNSKKG